MSDSFEILYAAHTATCTFLLDSEGICRRIALASPAKRAAGKGKDAAKAATRCVGAQYVASLDPTVSGMLAEMPRVGAAMLFARVDDRGRVSLVRTGVVTRFEGHREDPFAGGMPAKRAPVGPSTSVETSAPVITSSSPSPRWNRAERLDRNDRDHITDPAATVRVDDAARTERRMPTTPSPIHPMQGKAKPPPLPAVVRPAHVPHVMMMTTPIDDDSLDTTMKYESQTAVHPLTPPSLPREPRRAASWPSPTSSQPPTIRQALMPGLPPDSEDEHDPYAGPARPPPRRSEPFMTRNRSSAERTERIAGRPEPARPDRAPSYPAPAQERASAAGAVRRRGDR